MKKIFTLAFSILISSSIFAAAEFFIKINSSGNYSVSLNNQKMTSNNNIFRFFDLYDGNYVLKIYENGYNGRLIYNKPVNIKNGFRTVAELDKYSGLKIIDRIPYVQTNWYIDNLVIYQNQSSWNNNGPSTNMPPKPGCGNGWNNGNTNGNFPNNNPYNFPFGNGIPGYSNGNLLDDTSLQSLISTMKKQIFEDKMLETAKTALKNRTMQTNQVHQLLEQFTFEQNKLELAKYCYDKTTDQQNYYILYNDFVFNNYSSQLDKYINSK